MALLNIKQLAVSGASDGDAMIYDSGTGLWAPTAIDVPAWTSVEEVQFHSQGNQTLGSDTNYTIDSKTFTKINSAKDATAMAVVNGTGLRVQPASATNIDGGDYSAPGLRRLLATVHPAITPSTPVRVAFRMAANNTANYDVALAWIDSGNTSGEMRGLGGRLYAGGQKNQVGVRLGGTMTGEVLGTYGSENCYRLEMPGGVQGGHSRLYVGTAALGAWPTSWTLLGVTKTKLSTNTIDPATMAVAFGAYRAGSGTSLVVDFSGYKIEVYE